MKNNTTTLNIRKEANLTSYGTHHHHACKSIIAVDIHKTFNSVTDTAEYFGVSTTHISDVLNGRLKTIGLYERDENGNKIRRICRCRLTYAAHAETAIDAMMQCGRETTEKLDKANAYNNQLKNENTELKQEIAKLKSVVATKDSYKDCIESIKMDIKNYNASLNKAKDDVTMYTALLADAEQRLSDMIWGEGND